MAKNCAGVLLLGFALLLLSEPLASAADKPHPAHAKFRGLSYSDLQAMWWQAVYDVPVVAGEHPLINGGAFGGENKIVFLAGVVGAPATLEVTIPPGTALFLPVINAECSVIEPDPFHGDDEESLRECANHHIDHTSNLFAFVDGKAVKNLSSYRTESDLFEFGPLPENNILEFFGLAAPAGATSPAVDAGVYLLLTPLSVGTHTVRVGGTFDEFGASVDTTYIITVAPKKR